MQTKPVYLTLGGQQKLLKELEHLREVRRKEVAELIRNATESLDDYESPEYLDAKNEQAFVEGRILTLERILGEAVLVGEQPDDHETVCIGSHVTVAYDDGEQEELVLVGSAEVDAKARKISNESPVGKALIGHKMGDKMAVVVPSGTLNLTILAIA